MNTKKAIIMIIFITFNLLSCQNNTSKVWLHCANDIHKARHFQNKYAGLEIDITYVDSLQTLLVFKGEKTVKHNPITLEEWLNGIEKINNLGLWLDFKNLNNNNKTLILNELNRLCSKYGINKNNLIIESTAPYCLPTFQDEDYRTSFYIPKFKPKKSSESEILKHTSYIRDVISKYGITTISGYYYQYEFMRDSFPDQDLLIWYSLHNPIIRNKCIKLTNNDNDVKVLLVGDRFL